MVLGRKLLFVFFAFLGVQGSPSPLWHSSLYGFEDTNSEAIVVEVEERSGRQLSNSEEEIDDPMGYQGFRGFQPGIMGWPGQSAEQKWPEAKTTSQWTPDNSPWNPSTASLPAWKPSTSSKAPWTPDNSPWNPSTTKSPWRPPTSAKTPWTPDNSPWNPSTTTVSPWVSSTTTKNPWWNPPSTTTYPPWSSSSTTKNPWWTPSTTTVSPWISSTTTTKYPWTQPKTTASPWNPPSPTTKKPSAPPSSVINQQCGMGKYGPIRYNADGEVAEEINRIQGTHPLRVVNGWPSDKHEWPWIAALLNNGRQFCGGSLIDDRHILTAAHCVAQMSRYDVANLRIRLGAHYVRRQESGTHESEVARVVRHKGFSQQTLHWDVAIITMKTPVPANTPNIKHVCLDTGTQKYAGETATVTGWGSLKENGPQPEELMEVTVKIWDNTECKTTYGPNAPGGIEPYMLCAGQKGKDSCSGDSGGPMVKGAGSTWTQIGIVSWGIGCGKSHYPGVYTRVAMVKDWIQKIVKDY